MNTSYFIFYSLGCFIFSVRSRRLSGCSLVGPLVCFELRSSGKSGQDGKVRLFGCLVDGFCVV